MMRARRFALLLLFVAIGLTGPLPSPASLRAEDVRFIRIGTGPIGGTYFPVGGLIANVISAPPGSTTCDLGGSCGVPGLIAAAVSTEGSPDNVKGMTTGALDLALSQADVAHDAFTGSGLFAGNPVATLRVIANLFPEAVHVVVRQDGGIRSIGELKGKRVSLGEKNSGTLATARIVLRGYGVALNDLKPVYEKLARSADMLAAREIDAFFMVGGPPIAAIARSAERDAIALLPIAGRDAARIIGAQPFFSSKLIPGDTYTGVPATETIGVGAQFLVSANMDEDLVYGITRSLWDPRNRKVLDGGSPTARRMRLQSALDGLAVPLHPGARRFYVEAGMMQAGNL